MKILGIESTCDETGVAIVENGVTVIANELASSSDILSIYGGVVPELAAREQIKAIIPTIERVLGKMTFSTVDAVAVSYGPGLVGSLLIGVETAKTIAVSLNLPLYAINHLEGHIYANWLEQEVPPNFPLIGLIVSGGHTDIVYMEKHGSFKVLGSTLDDACGEAFDKAARILHLPYPGGPQIEKAALLGLADIPFPRSMLDSGNYNFSFSGIKTAVLNYVEKNNVKLTKKNIADISASFQQSVIDILAKKISRAVLEYQPKSVVVGGGVAANNALRNRLKNDMQKLNIKLFFPGTGYSVDNGAMIAAAAFFAGKAKNPLTVQAKSDLHF